MKLNLCHLNVISLLTCIVTGLFIQGRRAKPDLQMGDSWHERGLKR